MVLDAFHYLLDCFFRHAGLSLWTEQDSVADKCCGWGSACNFLPRLKDFNESGFCFCPEVSMPPLSIGVSRRELPIELVKGNPSVGSLVVEPISQPDIRNTDEQHVYNLPRQNCDLDR